MAQTENQTCSFCFAQGSVVEKLINGPDINICSGCVDRLVSADGDASRLRDGESFLRESGDVNENRWSSSCCFCGKGPRGVKWLFGSGEANICNECVALCLEILEERRNRASSPKVVAQIVTPSSAQRELRPPARGHFFVGEGEDPAEPRIEWEVYE